MFLVINRMIAISEDPFQLSAMFMREIVALQVLE